MALLTRHHESDTAPSAMSSNTRPSASGAGMLPPCKGVERLMKSDPSPTAPTGAVEAYVLVTPLPELQCFNPSGAAENGAESRLPAVSPSRGKNNHESGISPSASSTKWRNSISAEGGLSPSVAKQKSKDSSTTNSATALQPHNSSHSQLKATEAMSASETTRHSFVSETISSTVPDKTKSSTCSFQECHSQQNNDSHSQPPSSQRPYVNDQRRGPESLDSETTRSIGPSTHKNAHYPTMLELQQQKRMIPGHGHLANGSPMHFPKGQPPLNHVNGMHGMNMPVSQHATRMPGMRPQMNGYPHHGYVPHGVTPQQWSAAGRPNRLPYQQPWPLNQANMPPRVKPHHAPGMNGFGPHHHYPHTARAYDSNGRGDSRWSDGHSPHSEHSRNADLPSEKNSNAEPPKPREAAKGPPAICPWTKRPFVARGPQPDRIEPIRLRNGRKIKDIQRLQDRRQVNPSQKVGGVPCGPQRGHEGRKKIRQTEGDDRTWMQGLTESRQVESPAVSPRDSFRPQEGVDDHASDSANKPFKRTFAQVFRNMFR